MKPNFLIIGAPKAGTTSLWYLLRENPQVCMASLKEPMFFSDHRRYAKGWSWYQSLFDASHRCRAVGEASTHYSLVDVFPHAPRRIAADLPQVRIIYCVRDPATALPSWFKQLLANGTRIVDRHRLPARMDKAIREYRPMLSMARYWRNLSAYRSFIPDDRIHVIFFEEFMDNPQAVVDGCCEFLGVAPHRLQSPKTVWNASEGKLVWPTWISRWRGTSCWRLGRHVVPRPLREMARRHCQSPLPRELPWDAATTALVHEALADDAARLLAYCGKPSDFWQIAPMSVPCGT